MQVINRTAIVLKPKQPFLDWLNALPDNDGMTFTLERVREGGTAYLVPDYDYDEQTEECIKKVYPDLFAEELWDWCTEEDWWPERRDLRTFRKWFDVEVHSVVADLLPDDIEKEEM